MYALRLRCKTLGTLCRSIVLGWRTKISGIATWANLPVAELLEPDIDGTSTVE